MEGDNMSLTTDFIFEDMANSYCKITLTDLFGQRKSMVFTSSAMELRHSFYNWRGGQLIQDAFPYLDTDEREFIMTGTNSDEWKELMGDDDE